MQQVSAAGNALLTAGGTFVAGDVASTNGVDYLQVTQDQDQNFLVAFNNLVNFNDLSALRIQPNGTILWNDTLVTNGGYSAYPQPVSDGKRGMYLFYENTNHPQKLYAFGLDSMGRKYAAWSLPGSSFGDISTYDVFEPNYDFSAVAGDSSKAVVAWTRLLPSGLFGVFNCNLLPDGSVCTNQPFNTSAISNHSVCGGTVDTLQAFATGGNGPYQYNWQTASGDTLSCHNCTAPKFTATQNSTFIVTITDADLYQLKDTIHYSVNGGNNVHVSSSGTDTFCRGGSVTLSTGNGGSGFQWTLNGNNITGANSNSYTVTDSTGSYQLKMTEAGCPATSNLVNVSITSGPTALITPSGPITVCTGTTVPFQVSTGPNYHYEWVLDGRTLFSDSNRAGITAVLAGSYFVIVTNGGHCVDTSNHVIVNIEPLPIVYFTVGSGETLCSGSGAIALTGGHPAGGHYSGTGVLVDSLFNPSSVQNGNYDITYTYTGGNGCSNIAHEQITVQTCSGISAAEENDFSLFPNPANDQLTIRSSAIGTTKVQPTVYDITGKQITLGYEYEADKIVTHTAGLSPGIYLIKIELNNTILTRKFIKAE